jgi:hypothetical protein
MDRKLMLKAHLECLPLCVLCWDASILAYICLFCR